MKIPSINLSLNKREKMLLLALCAAIAIGLYMRVAYKPAAAHLRKARAAFIKARNELDSLKAELPDLEVKRAGLEKAKRRYEALKERLEGMESEIPSKTKLSQPSQFLNELAGEPGQFGMDVISIRPRRLEPKSGEFYAKMEVEMNFSSPYDGLIRYLDKIYTLSDYLKVTGIEVMADDKVSPNPYTHLKMETVLSELPSKARMAAEKKPVKGLELKAANPFKPPFKPRSRTGGLSGFEVSGILWKGGSPIAIVNGETVKVGDMVNGKKVAAILSNEVILQDRDNQYELKMREK